MLIVVLLELLILCVEDELLYDPLFTPYSNHTVTLLPLAFTVPFNVAEFAVTSVAFPLTTSSP